MSVLFNLESLATLVVRSDAEHRLTNNCEVAAPPLLGERAGVRAGVVTLSPIRLFT